MTSSPDSPAKRCSICGKPAEQAFRPFCSRRCADVDLHRWLSGRYVVPGSEDDEEDAEPSIVPRLPGGPERP